MSRFFFCFLLFFYAVNTITAQSPIYKNGTAAARQKQYQSTVNISILKNITVAIADSTEDAWQSAFWGIQHLNYKSEMVKIHVKRFATEINRATISTQISFWAMCYEQFPQQFTPLALQAVDSTTHPKLFAIAAEYLLKYLNRSSALDTIQRRLQTLIAKSNVADTNVFFKSLAKSIRKKVGQEKVDIQQIKNYLKAASQQQYLPGQVLVFSLQYANRNKPGALFIKSADGSLLKNDSNKIIVIPQLARSSSNVPGYLCNGNTPQGYFRMNGFAQSRLDAIGPTENIQLAMPFEISTAEFWGNANSAGSPWSVAQYQTLMPAAGIYLQALCESYEAGRAGRFEIIAHGTTVNPEYYKKQPYYPFTPTAGCLCTKEFWSLKDGSRQSSDQQTLIEAVKKAGGPQGYFIVLEIPENISPITSDRIQQLIK